MKKDKKKYVKSTAKTLISPLLWLTPAFLVFISVDRYYMATRYLNND